MTAPRPTVRPAATGSPRPPDRRILAPVMALLVVFAAAAWWTTARRAPAIPAARDRAPAIAAVENPPSAPPPREAVAPPGAAPAAGPPPPASTPAPALPTDGTVTWTVRAIDGEGAPYGLAGWLHVAFLDASGRPLALHQIAAGTPTPLPRPVGATSWALAAEDEARAVAVAAWGALREPDDLEDPQGSARRLADIEFLRRQDPPPPTPTDGSTLLWFADLDMTRTIANPFSHPEGITTLPLARAFAPAPAPADNEKPTSDGQTAEDGAAMGDNGAAADDGAADAPAAPTSLSLDLHLTLAAIPRATLHLEVRRRDGSPLADAACEQLLTTFGHASPYLAGFSSPAYRHFATIDAKRSWPRIANSTLHFAALPAGGRRLDLAMPRAGAAEGVFTSDLHLLPGATQTVRAVLDDGEARDLRVVVFQRASDGRGPAQRIAGAHVEVTPTDWGEGVGILPDGTPVLGPDDGPPRRDTHVYQVAIRPPAAVFGDLAAHPTISRGRRTFSGTTDGEGIVTFGALPTGTNYFAIAVAPDGTRGVGSAQLSSRNSRSGDMITTSATGEVNRRERPEHVDEIAILLLPDPPPVDIRIDCPDCPDPIDGTLVVIPHVSHWGSSEVPDDRRLTIPVRENRARFVPPFAGRWSFRLRDAPGIRLDELNRLHVPRMNPTEEHVLKATPEATLHVRVRDRADREPLAGLRIEMKKEGHGGATTAFALTDDAGAAVLVAVPGEFHLYAVRPSPTRGPEGDSPSYQGVALWHLDTLSLPFADRPTERTYDVVVGSLAVSVRDATTQEPAPRVSVSLRHDRGERGPVFPGMPRLPPDERVLSMPYITNQQSTDASGLAFFPEVGPNDYIVDVRARGYRAVAERVRVEEAETSLLLELETGGGTLRLTVVDADGAAVPRYHMGTLWNEATQERVPFLEGHVVGPDGIGGRAIPNLAPGRYGVSVSAGGGQGSARNVDVRDGETTDVRIVVSQAGSFSLKAYSTEALAAWSEYNDGVAAGVDPEVLRERMRARHAMLPDRAGAIRWRFEPLDDPATSQMARNIGPQEGRFEVSKSLGQMRLAQVHPGRFRLRVEGEGVVCMPGEVEIVVAEKTMVEQQIEFAFVE